MHRKFQYTVFNRSECNKYFSRDGVILKQHEREKYNNTLYNQQQWFINDRHLLTRRKTSQMTNRNNVEKSIVVGMHATTTISKNPKYASHKNPRFKQRTDVRRCRKLKNLLIYRLGAGPITFRSGIMRMYITIDFIEIRPPSWKV